MTTRRGASPDCATGFDAALMAPITVTVESIAAGGDGVGAREGLVVFVPRTAPGDRGRRATSTLRGRSRAAVRRSS